MCRRRPLPRSGKPWDIDTPIDMAFPCATQNEVLLADAKTLASHGCKYVLEGANMPCTPEAAHHFIKNSIIYVCGKAANAGACVPGWKRKRSYEPSHAFQGTFCGCFSLCCVVAYAIGRVFPMPSQRQDCGFPTREHWHAIVSSVRLW